MCPVSGWQTAKVKRASAATSGWFFMMSNGYKLTRYSASPRETLLDRPKRVAREVDMPLLRHHDVILDPNAAELAEIVHLRPVHVPVSYTHLRAHETDSYVVC